MFLIPTVEPERYDYFFREDQGEIDFHFYQGQTLSPYLFWLSRDERNPKLGEGFCKERK